MQTLQSFFYLAIQIMSIKINVLGYSISLFNVASFNICGGLLLYFLWKITE